ncbi:unnamed protein product [Clonostachys rosea]|uniref:Zn(2)-C6 fungal-type domain-containing protein n=1 Tax=Bionectria ochroleuca TaxID=29856 RepID=A0ABY6V166_BIOOC|nr:unnamed protein product [Clonostachys rosea]
MVGVVRSLACQNCKNQRIKCDENWPTCGKCLRRGFKCPGPSNLIRFVDGSTYLRNDKGSKALATTPKTQKELPPASSSNAAASTARTTILESRPINDRGIYLPASNTHSSYRKFRLLSVPARLASTPEDRVGSQLVSSLQGDEYLAGIFTLLQHMPARVSHSPCLRDAISLFCSTYECLQRGGSTSMDVKILRDYGKSLRTLRRTLEGKQAGDLETFAAVALISRSESVFNPTWNPFNRSHAEAIVAFVAQRGLPKADYDFHSEILFQALEDLMFYSLGKGVAPIYDKSPYKEAIAEAMLRFFAPALRPYATPLIRILMEYFTKAPRLLSKVQRINRDSTSPLMRDLAIKIVNALDVDTDRARNALDPLLKKAFETGEISEVEATDPDFFLPTYYKLKPDRFGECLNLISVLLVGMARIRYDLSVMYGLPFASEIYATYRKECVEMWKFIPFRIQIFKTFGFRAVSMMTLPYECTQGREREYMNDLFLKENVHPSRLPTDRRELEAAMLLRAKAMTGRLPFIPEGPAPQK